MSSIKIAIVKASDFIRANLSRSSIDIAAAGAIVIPINDIYFNSINRQERFQIFYGGSGSGKSHFVATLLLLKAMRKEHFRCLYVRKYERTVRASQFALFKDLISAYNLTDFFDVNEGDMRIRCRPTGNMLLPAGLDDVHKIRSVPGLNAVWIEELIDRKGAISQADFLELNRRLRETSNNVIYMTFNPIIRQSWVHSMFFTEARPDAFILKTTYKDNLFLPDEFKSQMEALKHISPDEYAVFTQGEWGSMDSADLYLFEEPAVHSLHTNADFIAGGETYITCDVAFTGEDKTVVMAWQGWKVVDVKVLAKSSATEIVSAIRSLAATHRVPQGRVCFDATGAGIALRSLMPAAIAFDASASPIDDAPLRPQFSRQISPRPPYRNLRAQVYDACAKVVNSNLAAYAPTFGLEQLQQELMQVRWLSANDTIKHQLESKDIIRARLGRSPDFADAFAMRAIFDLQKSSSIQRKQRQIIAIH